jgi:hypothetical protein
MAMRAEGQPLWIPHLTRLMSKKESFLRFVMSKFLSGQGCYESLEDQGRTCESYDRYGHGALTS